MKVIIAGGRDFIPQKQHHIWLLIQLKELNCTEVICILFPGGRGTEHMRNIAIEYGLKLIEYKEN